MTDAVHDYKSIARKLNRQDQKAEFEAKNPKVEPSMYGWPYGVAVPYAVTLVEGGEWIDPRSVPEGEMYHSAKFEGDLEWDAINGWRGVKPARKSLAHPEWPYTGTPHEWPKFKI